eukprot:TRINITY_DN316_c0_g1_i2.p1 TRINITY_DN316_c0_g1~~TRINITY_DN316_c0_g1_i2.p1  ORF type:complete len:198 (+),score=55.61 TRINITY_DN316_c0_g1_i2:74-667(+)
MIRRPPRSTLSSSSAASDVYKRQEYGELSSDNMNSLTNLFIALALMCMLNISPASARCNDPAVCKQWYNDIFNTIDYSWSNVKVESHIEKYCDKIGDTKPMSKMCYYMLGVKRKVSTDMLQGAPAELACRRYSSQDPSICSLRFPQKLDPNMNLEKMRVKELRHLMQEYEVECHNCLEKSDMIKVIREKLMPAAKEL